jgi:alpha-L-glutamate ligase-like protein
MALFHPNNILGMNRRNADYILRYNDRRYYPLVDDKFKAKELMISAGIPTPQLYAKIEYNFQIRGINFDKFPNDFVIKPARGSEGRGIIVIESRDGHYWKKTSGALISLQDFHYHMANALSGLYSLGGVQDKILIEYRVQNHPILEPMTFQGVPDLRLVMYRGIPVMAMLRLPTRESDGKANLHLGALGVGIDMMSGNTLGGYKFGHRLKLHPDTDHPVQGCQIPYWKDMLHTASRLYDWFPLGYIGIDFVIDKKFGPMVIELNARPGLRIQLANQRGLVPYLNKVDHIMGGRTDMDKDERLAVMYKVI